METIQVHAINTNPFAFTIKFQKDNVKTKHRIINAKSAWILKIPPPLVLIDMFHNEVLTPFEEMYKVCHDNIKALLAWDVINMLDALILQNPLYFRNTAHLLLAAASLEKINDFSQTYLDRTLSEIDAYEKGEIKLEDSMYAGFMIEEVEAHVNPLFKDYLLHLNPKGRTECLSYVRDLYKDLAHLRRANTRNHLLPGGV